MFFVKTICFFQKYVTVIFQGGFTEMNFVAMDFETANHQPYSACSLALVMVNILLKKANKFNKKHRIFYVIFVEKS